MYCKPKSTLVTAVVASFLFACGPQEEVVRDVAAVEEDVQKDQYPPDVLAAVEQAHTTCTGRNYASIFHRYDRNGETKVLRCGNDRFGWWHIAEVRKRWDSRFEKNLAATITRGRLSNDGRYYYKEVCVRGLPGVCFDTATMIVPYGENAYAGKDVRPVGVITAYYDESEA